MRRNKTYPVIRQMGHIWRFGFIMVKPKVWDEERFRDMVDMRETPWKFAQRWLEIFGYMTRCKHIHSYELQIG